MYARLYHTIWTEPVPYQNVILLMGGFYQIRGVQQKIISKQHNIIGSHKWLRHAGVGGRRYYSNYYKELFYVVVQYKGEALTKNIFEF